MCGSSNHLGDTTPCHIGILVCKLLCSLIFCLILTTCLAGTNVVNGDLKTFVSYHYATSPHKGAAPIDTCVCFNLQNWLYLTFNFNIHKRVNIAAFALCVKANCDSSYKETTLLETVDLNLVLCCGSTKYASYHNWTVHAVLDYELILLNWYVLTGNFSCHKRAAPADLDYNVKLLN